MNKNKIKFYIFSVILFLIIILLTWFFVINRFFNYRVKPDRASVIKEMRNLQRLETASFTIEKIIDAGTENKNIFQKFLFGDRILLIAHGQIIAGFDLSSFSEKDITIIGDYLKITLPAPQILVSILDNAQTKVYDRQRGILISGNNNLEAEARQEAEKTIKEAACQGKILEQASDNARKQLTALFKGLGFSTVTIEIPNPITC